MKQVSRYHFTFVNRTPCRGREVDALESAFCQNPTRTRGKYFEELTIVPKMGLPRMQRIADQLC